VILCESDIFSIDENWLQNRSATLSFLEEKPISGMHPVTAIAIFPWCRRGHIGSGQVTVTSFKVPEYSMKFWESRQLLKRSPSFAPARPGLCHVIVFAEPAAATDVVRSTTSCAVSVLCLLHIEEIRALQVDVSLWFPGIDAICVDGGPHYGVGDVVFI
jgi:hypothetical protein